MAKIDLEKVLIALLDSPFNKQFDDKIKNALKEQGFEYKDGEIVESQKTKFKVGDWVVDEQGDSFIINSIERGFYFTQLSGCCYQTPLDIDLVDNSYHAWTIEDAKDGDMLCGYLEADYPWIGIFHKLNVDGTFNSYCYLQAGLHGKFCPPSGENIFGKRNVDNHSSSDVVPATNAQRALLFQKMKEAGYEWDAEKKELKKIYKPLYEAGNIIIYKGYSYCIKEVVKDEERGFYYNLVAIDGGKVNRIGPAGEKDITLLWNNANIQQKDFSLKAIIANRQLYNRAILKLLSNYVEKYPDIRFGQMLCNLDVNPHFDEESRETYCNLNETINKSKDESKN